MREIIPALPGMAARRAGFGYITLAGFIWATQSASQTAIE